MSNLVDQNRAQFKKIFEAHQQKSTLSYTDALKICSSLKIFPDLLASQDIRKIFLTLSTSDSGSERMNFLQFESFLKIISKQSFKHTKKLSDDYGRFISHIKDTSQRRYGVVLENAMQKCRSLSKTMNSNRNSKKSVSTPKNSGKNSLIRPGLDKESEKSSHKKSPVKLVGTNVKAFVNLLSPGIKNLKSRIEANKGSALTDRREGHNSACSTSPSPNKPALMSRINKAFAEFQSNHRQIHTEKFETQRKLKGIMEKEVKKSEGMILLKMAFRIWTLTV